MTVRCVLAALAAALAAPGVAAGAAVPPDEGLLIYGAAARTRSRETAAPTSCAGAPATTSSWPEPDATGSSPGGDDLLRSADGVRDLVAGGRGADRGRADERDLVLGVERVARVVPRRRG